VAEILDGKAAAAEIRSEVSSEVAELLERGVPVRLDVVLVGDDPASVTYVGMKQRDCAEVGIESEVHRFDAGVAQGELAALVKRLNDDAAVSGFFVQLPLPEGLEAMSLISRISPAKDVDGLSPESAGRLALGLSSLLPCTPHGVIQLLSATVWSWPDARPWWSGAPTSSASPSRNSSCARTRRSPSATRARATCPR
jgi:methylenetetrahydrofolate dehydrogenase (NADP+)/methenyltetrahydrofolate cyclohydrolase